MEELVPLKTINGEEKAWSIIGDLSPGDVCARTGAAFDSGRSVYTVPSFGIDFSVSPQERRISSDAPGSVLFLGTLKDFFKLPLLWYLTSAKDIPSTGRLIKPIDVKGGQRFFSGTHVLPLDKIAVKYGADKSLFLGRGRELGAEVLGFGDASLRFYPLPRVPVTMILWLEDEEFPPRVDLLFDSTIDMQISLSDIIWSVAVLTSLVMLQ